MEADVKKLDRICRDLADVEMGLMEGTIDFSYDKLMSAMKPGHPCEIMDGILANIYYPAMRGQEPPMDVMEKTLKNLQTFGKAFSIKEINKPLKELDEYIQARKLG